MADRHLERLQIEGEALARRFGCKFIETSAKSRINVDNSFYEIVREIRRYNKEMYPAPNVAGASQRDKLEIGEEDQGSGCCGGRCIVM